MVTSFGLIPEGVDNYPVITRDCNVWNLGIHWKDMNGIEVVVEFNESFKCVLLEMGCQKGSELYLVKLRSKIMKIILEIKNDHAKGIKGRESFLYPPHLTPDGEVYEFSKTRLWEAVTKGHKYIVSKRGASIKQVLLNDLLYVEPLALMPYEIVNRICQVTDGDCSVDLFLYEELRHHLENDITGIKDLILTPRMMLKQLRDIIFSYSIFDAEVSWKHNLVCFILVPTTVSACIVLKKGYTVAGKS